MEAYRRLRSHEAYRNRWVSVHVHDVVHPSGVAGEHVAILTPPASAVIVCDGADMLFVRQQRFAAEMSVLEIVKGGAENGESALACAQRELREELGLDASDWEPLGSLYEIPSIVVHPVALFIARGLRPCAGVPEDVETIAPVRMTLASAFERAREGKLVDAITLAALLRFALHTGALVPT